MMLNDLNFNSERQSLRMRNCRFISEAVLASIIGGASAVAGSAVSAGVNAGTTSAANKKSYKWTKKLYQYQHDTAMQDWMLQNWYNSPEQQMLRFKQAGLNPNLIYGQSNTGVSFSEPSMSQFNAKAVSVPEIDFGTAISTYLAAERLEADKQLKDSMVDKNNAATQTMLETLAPKVEKMISEAVDASNKAKYSDEFYGSRAKSLSLSNDIKKIQIDSGFYELQTELAKARKRAMETQIDYMETNKQFLLARLDYQRWMNELSKAFDWEERTLSNEQKRQNVKFMRRHNRGEEFRVKNLQDLYNWEHTNLSRYGWKSGSSLAAVLQNLGLSGTRYLDNLFSGNFK